MARVEEALKYVAPERLSLNPDCGFAPGIEAEIPLEEAYLKLKNEAEAARPPAGQVRLTETVSGAVRSACQQGFLDHAVSGLGSRRSSSKRTRAAPPPPRGSQTS